MEDVSLVLAVALDHPAWYVERTVGLHRRHPAQSTREPGLRAREESHRLLVARRLQAILGLRGESEPGDARSV